MQPDHSPDNELAANELELSEGERTALEGKDDTGTATPAAEGTPPAKTEEELQAEADAAAAAEATAAAAAAVDDPAAVATPSAPAPTPFVPQYQVDSRDFGAELTDINSKLVELRAAYKDGKIEDEAYETQFEQLQEQKSDIRLAQNTASITATLNQQNQDQQWAYLQRQFLSLPENAALASNPMLFSAWETAMQVVVDEAAKAGTALLDWDLLSHARQKLVEGGMMGAAAARPQPTAAAAAAAEVPAKPDRRAPLKDVPATLSGTPAAADALARTASDQLADEDSIEDLEEKLAGMSESARDRVLSQVPGGFVDG
jgi:hypothetical protein